MKDNTIHILLAGVDDSHGADFTKALRRNGYVARIATADKMDQFDKALAEGKTDVVILAAKAPRLDLGKCRERLDGGDVPLVVLADSAEELLEPQVADVLPPGDAERLAHCCVREFHARNLLLELREVRSQLQAAEQRNSLLLAEADDALAYVADGMVIASNEHFARQLGFGSCEDLDCMPVVDLVSDADQERLKNALKSQARQDKNQLSVSVQRGDGQPLAALLQLQNTKYDGEPCVQLRLIAGEGEGRSASSLDRVTGLTVADVFVEQLQDVLQHGLGGDGDGALLLIALDSYHELRSKHGLRHTEALLADLAELVKSELGAEACGRVGDDLLACLLRDVDAEQAQKRAKSLCKKAVKRIVEFGGQSLQYTVSIAVAGIEQRKMPPAMEMLDQLYGTCENIGLRGGNDAAVHVRQRQTLSRDQATTDIIEEAMADQRLQLLFQPLVNLGEVEGDHYEVLLDLKQRQSEEISGMELLAKSEGRAGDTALDRWILMEATKRLAEARAGNADLRLVINLSCNVLEDAGFLSWLAVALKAARLSSQLLILQFDQQFLASQLKNAQTFAKQLRALGCRLSVREVVQDNHSSQLLKLLKPDTVKLRNGLGKQNDRNTLSQLIGEVHKHDGKAIIPEVDSAATLATLWQLGPDFVQGSYVQDADTEMNYEFAELV